MVKMAEWWLGLTTPDQCGQNPGQCMYIYTHIFFGLVSNLTKQC